MFDQTKVHATAARDEVACLSLLTNRCLGCPARRLSEGGTVVFIDAQATAY
jgi:hypothetical protein